jgi:hypothetical protein
MQQKGSAKYLKIRKKVNEICSNIHSEYGIEYNRGKYGKNCFNINNLNNNHPDTNNHIQCCINNYQLPKNELMTILIDFCKKNGIDFNGCRNPNGYLRKYMSVSIPSLYYTLKFNKLMNILFNLVRYIYTVRKYYGNGYDMFLVTVIGHIDYTKLGITDSELKEIKLLNTIPEFPHNLFEYIKIMQQMVKAEKNKNNMNKTSVDSWPYNFFIDKINGKKFTAFLEDFQPWSRMISNLLSNLIKKEAFTLVDAKIEETIKEQNGIENIAKIKNYTYMVNEKYITNFVNLELNKKSFADRLVIQNKILKTCSRTVANVSFNNMNWNIVVRKNRRLKIPSKSNSKKSAKKNSRRPSKSNSKKSAKKNSRRSSKSDSRRSSKSNSRRSYRPDLIFRPMRTDSATKKKKVTKVR